MMGKGDERKRRREIAMKRKLKWGRREKEEGQWVERKTRREMGTRKSLWDKREDRGRTGE